MAQVTRLGPNSPGIATGWTGEDMSTPLLPEVVPEIDANRVSLYPLQGGGDRGSVRFGLWSLTGLLFHNAVSARHSDSGLS